MIQVFVAGFSSFLVVGLSALVDPTAFPQVGTPVVATDGVSSFADDLRAHGLEVSPYAGEDAAMRAFRAGLVDAVLLAGPSPEGDPSGLPIDLLLVLPDGDFRATLTLVRVKAALEAHERTLREENAARLHAEPVYVDAETRSGSFAFVYSLLVPLLVLLPVVLAGALSADSLTEEVQRGTLQLLLASPARLTDVVEGKLQANVLLVPLLVVAWLVLLALNGLPVPLLGGALILVLSAALAFLLGLLACVVALATRDRNRAHLVYATGLFLLLALSLLLPTSPVNAVALLAAGSAGPAAYATVAVAVAAAFLGWIALRIGLRALAPRLAAT